MKKLIDTVKFASIRLVVKSLALFSPLLGKNRRIKDALLSDTKLTIFFSEMPSQEISAGLIEAFVKIFSEYPWFEHWEKEKVEGKIRKEVKLTKDSFLVIMKGDSQLFVGGFSWGAVLPIDSLLDRISEALDIQKDYFSDLIEILKKRKVDQVIYFDEFAVDRTFRGGIAPIRSLLLPGLQLGSQRDVSSTMFWTTKESKIMALAMLMGYEPIFKKNINGKEIVFMFNPSGRSLLKISENIDDKYIRFIMKAISAILKK